jgi:hypothetical protein
MNTSRKAFRFFLEHAGYATPPGRAACALGLSRAEERAKAVGITFEWEWDEDADLSWMDDRDRYYHHDGGKRHPREHEVLGCIARGPDGEHLASLWGIVDADASYRRVVEAELAAEALADYVAPVCGCP